MSPAVSSLWWAVIGPPLANHLWQSTLFAGVAGLLTLLLRKNHARTRYLLWLLASAKFLIPFSVLVGIGSHLGWSKVAVNTQPGFFLVMQEISQPFTLTKPTHHALPAVSTLALTTRALPTLLLVVWFCGFAAVLFSWWFRVRRATAALGGALSPKLGREFEALRCLEKRTGIADQIDLMLSKSALEPGILGIFRPILLLPLGISERLTDAQLDAIITHELCHVRYWDNLSAAVHMLVEALFWFHPLVWWIGALLVDERERACDEEVLRLGSDPQTYAEGILRICEFYLESPLFCAAGVTGSNLKKRIEAIMVHRIPIKLDFARKLLLSSVGFITVAIPIVFGILHATQARAGARAQNTASSTLMYAAVSIKPLKPAQGMVVSIRYPANGLNATYVTLQMLIREAYGIEDIQVIGAPTWIKSEWYGINAKVDSSVADKLRELTEDQRWAVQQPMLQALLADRFKLTFHRETRQASAYALVIAENGPKLQQSKPGDTYPNGIGGGPGTMQVGRGLLIGQGVPVSDVGCCPKGSLVHGLTLRLDRPVVDQTGLTGNFDFTLQWTPDSSSGSSGPSLFTAIEEQLGLKLEPQESPVDLFVIDNVEKPSQKQ